LKDVLGSCFVDKVKQSNLFQKIEYFHDLPHDFSEKTIGEGYDAIIRIYLKDVSLIRVAGEKLELFIDARATMTSLVSEETVWSRQETQMTNERFSLEFLESHGDEVRKIFYQMIENLGERLANEFLYVK